MSEWRAVALGEVSRKIGSGATPRGGRESYVDDGIALIRSMNVFDARFVTNGLAHITDEQAAALENVNVEAGDVLVNITGASVARSCVAPSAVLPARVNQHVAIVRLDQTKADPRFVNAYLVSRESKARLLNLAAAGATREALTKAMLEQFTIRLPELKVQRRAAAVLGAIDDLTDNNRRRVAILGEIAQAIYRAWFICCWTRRRTSSTTCVPSLTTWKASSTATASGNSSRRAFGVAAERVQRRMLDAGDERLGLRLQPARVGVARVARDDIEQAGVKAAVLITGEVHHRRRGAVAVPDPAGPPHVLVHPDGAHPVQTCGVGEAAGRFDLDGVPAGVPVHPQVPGQRQDGGVVLGERVGGPGDCPRGELRPRPEHRMLLAARPTWARRVGAAPDPFAPPHPGRDAEPGRVGRVVHPPAMPDPDDAAGRTTAHVDVGLHREHEPARFAVHLEHVHAGNVEQHVDPGAPAHARTTPTVIHVGVFCERLAWSLLDHEGPDPITPATPRGSPHPRSDPKTQQ